MERTRQIKSGAVIICFLVLGHFPMRSNCLPLKENGSAETTLGHTETDVMTVEEFVASLNDTFPKGLSREGTLFEVEGIFSCKGNCGFQSRAFCSCKPTCVAVGTCCQDFREQCKKEPARLESDLWWLKHISFSCVRGMPVYLVTTCPDPSSILHQSSTSGVTSDLQSTPSQTTNSHMRQTTDSNLGQRTETHSRQTRNLHNRVGDSESSSVRSDSLGKRRNILGSTTTSATSLPESVVAEQCKESTDKNITSHTEDSVNGTEMGITGQAKKPNDIGQPGNIKCTKTGKSGGGSQSDRTDEEIITNYLRQKDNTIPPMTSSPPTLSSPLSTDEVVGHSQFKVNDYMASLWDKAQITDLDSGVVFMNESIYACYQHLAKSPEYWTAAVSHLYEDDVNVIGEPLSELTKVVSKESLPFYPSYRAEQLSEKCFDDLQNVIKTCPEGETDPMIRKGCLGSVAYIAVTGNGKIYQSPFCVACNVNEFLYRMILLDPNLGQLSRGPQGFGLTMKLQPDQRRATFTLSGLPTGRSFKIPGWQEMTCTLPDYLTTRNLRRAVSIENDPVSMTKSLEQSRVSDYLRHGSIPSTSQSICRAQSCNFGDLSDGECIVETRFLVKLPETLAPLCQSFLNNLTENIWKSVVGLDNETLITHNSHLLYKNPSSFSYQLTFTLTSTFYNLRLLSRALKLIFAGIELELNPLVLKTDRICVIQVFKAEYNPAHTWQCDPINEKVFLTRPNARYLAVEDITCSGYGKHLPYLHILAVVLLYGLFLPELDEGPSLVS